MSTFADEVEDTSLEGDMGNAGKRKQKSIVTKIKSTETEISKLWR